MKKLLIILLAFSMVVGLVACAPGEKPPEESKKPGETQGETQPPEQKKFLVGYSYPTRNNEFWTNCYNVATEAAAALGVDMMIDDCNNDQAEQLADVESMLAAGIDALILAPQDASVCPGILSACKAKGIPAVVIDRWPGDDLKAGDDYICFIGPNDEAAGYGIAKNLIDGGCTKIVGIGGFQNTSVAEGRYKGLVKAMDEHPNIELLQYEWAGEDMEVGDEYMRNLLSAKPELDGVWCYNDSLALASVNVLKEQNRTDVKVAGMDLLGPAIESMEKGELWSSTGGHYYMPGFALCILYDVLNGIEYDGAGKVLLDLLNVHRENLDDFKTKYQGADVAIDWVANTKVNNPNASYTFILSLD